MTSAPVGAMKRPSDVPRGEQGRLLTVDRRHGGHCGIQQGAGVGQEGLAGEGPLDLVVEAVTIQQGFDPLADPTIGEPVLKRKLNWTCSSPG